MADNYGPATSAKLDCIMMLVTRQYGYTHGLDELTAEDRVKIEAFAEQAAIEWAIASRQAPRPCVPVTNLEHIMLKYCAAATNI